MTTQLPPLYRGFCFISTTTTVTSCIADIFCFISTMRRLFYKGVSFFAPRGFNLLRRLSLFFSFYIYLFSCFTRGGRPLFCFILSDLHNTVRLNNTPNRKGILDLWRCIILQFANIFSLSGGGWRY